MANQQENSESSYNDIEQASDAIKRSADATKKGTETAKDGIKKGLDLAEKISNAGNEGSPTEGHAKGTESDTSASEKSQSPVGNSDNTDKNPVDVPKPSPSPSKASAGPSPMSPTGNMAKGAAGSSAGGAAGSAAGGAAGASAGSAAGSSAGAAAGGAAGGAAGTATGGALGAFGGPAGMAAGAEAGGSIGTSAGTTAGAAAGGTAGGAAGGAAGSAAGGAAGSSADGMAGSSPEIKAKGGSGKDSTPDGLRDKGAENDVKDALDKSLKATGNIVKAITFIPGCLPFVIVLAIIFAVISFLLTTLFGIAAGFRNTMSGKSGSVTNSAEAVMEGDYTTDLLEQYGLTAMTYFLPYESGEDAYDSAGSDSGHAFGAYQFDNRSELGPFIAYCYNQDSVKYGAFSPYVDLSAEALCGNSGLIQAWHHIYATYPDEFKAIQDYFAWNADVSVNPKSMRNVIEIQKTRGFDLTQCDAAVRGFVYSIQNRCGWEEYLDHSLCAKANVTNQMTDLEIIEALELTIRTTEFPSSEFAQPYTITERYVTGGSSVGWLGTPEVEVCKQLIQGTGQYGTGKRYLSGGGNAENTAGSSYGAGGKYKIAIDPGHQAHQDTGVEPNGPGSETMKQKVTSGTHGNASGLDESELNLQVSLKLRDELVARGYEVYMIRTSQDVQISNVERAQMANASGADAFVRIHANGDDSSSLNGALMYQPSDANPYMDSDVIDNSQRLSSCLLDSYCSATGLENLGLLDGDDMTGINWSEVPVSIVEMGFMSNESDDLFMASEDGQAKIVQGLANGIDAYFNNTSTVQASNSAGSKRTSATVASISNDSTTITTGPPDPNPVTVSGPGAAIILEASKYVGNPYVWGGNSLTNGCDCSHYVTLILEKAIGYDGGYHVSGEWINMGEPVESLDVAQPGDIIVWDGHVAFYDGVGLMYEAKGSAWGITHDRAPGDCHSHPFLGIRRMTATGGSAYGSVGRSGSSRTKSKLINKIVEIFFGSQYNHTGRNSSVVGRQAAQNEIVDYAKSWVGKISYHLGANEALHEGGESDCSWFIFHVMEHFGLMDSWYKSTQWGAGAVPNSRLIAGGMQNAQPGDVLFWDEGGGAGHVILYAGDGMAVGCNGITTVTGSVDYKEYTYPCGRDPDAIVRMDGISEYAYATNTTGTLTGGKDLGEWRLTAYCNCSACCGRWAGGPTASGVMPTGGRTVAIHRTTMEALGLKFGDRLLIRGHEYILEDHGGSEMGGSNGGLCVDIYVSNHNECYNDEFNGYDHIYYLGSS